MHNTAQIKLHLDKETQWLQQIKYFTCEKKQCEEKRNSYICSKVSLKTLLNHELKWCLVQCLLELQGNCVPGQLPSIREWLDSATQTLFSIYVRQEEES